MKLRSTGPPILDELIQLISHGQMVAGWTEGRGSEETTCSKEVKAFAPLGVPRQGLDGFAFRAVLHLPAALDAGFD